MKKAILAIMVLGLCFGLATVAMAQEVTGTTTVTVTVNEIDTLTVPGTVAITLDTVGTEGSYVQGTATGTDAEGLKYSHNSGTAKKITATAAAGGTNGTNDITLKVQVGTQTAQAVVTEGVCETTGVPLWTDILAGSHTQDLTWTADATLAGTKYVEGGYVFTVTFTATDVEEPTP